MTLSSVGSHAWRQTPSLRSTVRKFFATNQATEASSSFDKHYTFQGHTTSKKNKSSVTVAFDHHTILTDLPRAMGGQGRAPQPVEHLLAAWAGCTQATALFVSRHNMKCALERLEFVNMTASRDERGALALPIDENPPVPSRIHTITGTIVVWPSFGEDELRLLKEQTELRCPVANMLLASGCRIDVEWVNGSVKDEEDNNGIV